MDSGYIIPAPADFIINMDGEGVNFEWCANTVFYGNRYVKAHIPEQTEGMRHLMDQTKPVLDYTIKLELPWRVQAHYGAHNGAACATPSCSFLGARATHHRLRMRK